MHKKVFFRLDLNLMAKSRQKMEILESFGKPRQKPRPGQCDCSGQMNGLIGCACDNHPASST